MSSILQTLVVIVFFIGAVYYLYRRFRNITNPESSSCGCGGCGSGCDANTHPPTWQDPKQE